MTPSYITSEMSDDLEEALQLGAEAGVDTVHLRKGLFGKDVQDLTDDDVPRIQDTLGKFGARVGVLMPPFAKIPLDDADTINAHHAMFARLVEIARAFDAPFIRCFPFTESGEEPYTPDRLDAYLDRIVEKLGPSVSVAEAGGVTMCFEVVNSTIARTAADTRRILDALDSPAAKVIWEIDTAWRVGEKPSDGYAYVRDDIRDIHIKPNDHGEMDPIGDTGETHAGVIGRLHKDGYDGFVTIEHWKGTEGILRGLRQLTDTLATL